MKTEVVGEVAVDAGMIMIGDPCYHLHKNGAAVHPEFGSCWSEFVDITMKSDPATIGDGLAVVIGSFGGDGVYPVFIRRDEHGRIVEAGVRFQEVNDEN